MKIALNVARNGLKARCRKINETKLKPCPFCGDKAEIFIDDYGKSLIQCSNCGVLVGVEVENGVELKDGWRATFKTEEQAAEAWNRRVNDE